MFVSEIRKMVAVLLEEQLTLSEIAHRLGVANSTVGYHADALREGREGRSVPDRAPKRRGPVAAPDVTRERVRALLNQGHTRARIAEALGLARSTVTYHAGRLGHDIDSRYGRRYDWETIRRFYEGGHSVADCQARFGFNRNAWHDAIRRGVITPRPARMPLEQLLLAGPRRNRGHIKRRLFDAGIKTRKCESCGLSEWRGLPISLALHHVNGDRHDNRLENLQILCPNCHGLTDTWAGRNIPRLRGAASDAAGTEDRPRSEPDRLAVRGEVGGDRVLESGIEHQQHLVARFDDRVGLGYEAGPAAQD
jgi:DNA-binding CsgD family transcriptional regulator